MSEKITPYIGSDGDFYMDDDEIKLWDNTLMDGLKEIKVEEVIDKIRNYYNTCCDIDGRPPSKVKFNEFLDLL
jgi:hypothetical protein